MPNICISFPAARWCLLCESFHEEEAHELETHFRKWGESYTRSSAAKAKADELEISCDYCDGWPVFQTEEEFERHYFDSHMRQVRVHACQLS